MLSFNHYQPARPDIVNIFVFSVPAAEEYNAAYKPPDQP